MAFGLKAIAKAPTLRDRLRGERDAEQTGGATATQSLNVETPNRGLCVGVGRGQRERLRR